MQRSTAFRLFMVALILLSAGVAYAATRVGLHITAEEIACYKQRAGLVPANSLTPNCTVAYKSRNDVGRNNPGDYDRIKANADAFRGTPTRWRGNTTDSCMKDDEQVAPSGPGLTGGVRLRDAGFVWLLTGDATYRNAVRDMLIQLADDPNTNFAPSAGKFSRNTGCMSGIAGQEIQQINAWIQQLTIGYDYIRPSLTDAQRANIDAWLLDAGRFLAGYHVDYARTRFPNRDSYATPEQYPVSNINNRGCANDIRYSTAADTDGSSVGCRYVWQDAWNNLVLSHARTSGTIGVLLNNATLINDAKRHMREWMMFMIYPDGSSGELDRWISGPPNRGYGYVGGTISHYLIFADALARRGDTSLYEFSTSYGAPAPILTQGGPKSIHKVITTYLQMRDHTSTRYGAKCASCTHPASAIMDGVDPDGRHDIMDIPVAIGNLHFKSAYFKGHYLRNSADPDVLDYPSDSIAKGAPGYWGGNQSVLPGILFQFANLEGKVNPYGAPPPSGQPLTGEWLFNEGTGTTTADSSGSGNHGTLNSITWNTATRHEGAASVSFDAHTDYISVGTAGWSASQGTHTIWFGFDVCPAPGARFYLFGHTSSPPSFVNRIQEYVTSGCWLNLGLGGSHFTAVNITQLAANTWYFLALTWDGTNYAVRLAPWGAATLPVVASGTYTGLTALGATADIGNNGADHTEGFRGLIDGRSQVWNRVLTPTELFAEFTFTPPPPDPDPDPDPPPPPPPPSQLYIDGNLSGACTGNYSILNRNCSGNDGSANPNPAAGVAAAATGAVVLVRGGTYTLTGEVTPKDGQTLQRYQNEVPVFNGANLSGAHVVCVRVSNVSNVTVDGIRLEHCPQYGVNATIVADGGTCTNTTVKNLEILHWGTAAAPAEAAAIQYDRCQGGSILTNVIGDPAVPHQDRVGVLLAGDDSPAAGGGTVVERNRVAYTSAPETPSVGGNCRFYWEPVPEPDIHHYRLYWSNTAGEYGLTAFHRIEPSQTQILNGETLVTTTCSAVGVTTDQTFYAVVTAVDQTGNESVHSNEASWEATPPSGVGSVAQGIKLTSFAGRPTHAGGRHLIRRNSVRGGWLGLLVEQGASAIVHDNEFIDQQHYGDVALVPRNVSIRTTATITSLEAYQNTLVSPFATHGLQVSDEGAFCDECKLRNNVIKIAGPAPAVMIGVTSASDGGFEFDNNLARNTGSGNLAVCWDQPVSATVASCQTGSGAAQYTHDQMATFNTAQGQTGNLGSDPLFADEAAGDYSLGTLSPAADAGQNLSGACPTGMRCAFNGAGPAIGAYDPFTITGAEIGNVSSTSLVATTNNTRWPGLRSCGSSDRTVTYDGVPQRVNGCNAGDAVYTLAMASPPVDNLVDVDLVETPGPSPLTDSALVGNLYGQRVNNQSVQVTNNVTVDPTAGDNLVQAAWRCHLPDVDPGTHWLGYANTPVRRGAPNRLWCQVAIRNVGLTEKRAQGYALYCAKSGGTARRLTGDPSILGMAYAAVDESLAPDSLTVNRLPLDGFTFRSGGAVQNSDQSPVQTPIGPNQQIELAFLLQLGPDQPIGSTTWSCLTRTASGMPLAGPGNLPMDLGVDATTAYR